MKRLSGIICVLVPCSSVLRRFVAAGLLFVPFSIFSQSDPYFRQAENLLRTFNPAYNGLEDFDKRSLFLNFRNQWMNFDKGAPLTFSGTYGGHFDKLHGGMDVSYLFDRAGLEKTSWIGLKYDAQFKLGESSSLGFGMRANFGFATFLWSQAVTTTPDPSLPTTDSKDVIVPDIDFGMMFTHNRSFFISISARHITEPHAEVTGPTGTKFDYCDQYRTYYAMLGGAINVGSHLRINYSADYRATGNIEGQGEARIDARWRFAYAGFFCIVDDWSRYTNPYGFTFGFSKPNGKLHFINSIEPAFGNASSFGTSFETGVKYVFGKKD